MGLEWCWCFACWGVGADIVGLFRLDCLVYLLFTLKESSFLV